MSEPIPESIPTSSDRRSHRPVKKARADTPNSAQSAQLEALFANPDREIQIPTSKKAKTLAAPPEIVANVQGSSAGAGSGEFHVYKASRRREYERLRLMDEEVEREEKDKAWMERQEERKKVDDSKLSKSQAKRAKAKARKEKGKDVDAKDGPAANGVRKKLAPARIAAAGATNGANKGNEDGAGDELDGSPVVEEAGITFHDDD